MNQFRKKPVVIEAVQMASADGDFTLCPLWFAQARDNVSVYHESEDVFVVKTLEGDMRGTTGDYLIKGVAGELYSCKQEIFEATYERASPSPDLANHKFDSSGYLHLDDGPRVAALCSDCPPVGYPTDKTRCTPCPRRTELNAALDRSAIPPAPDADAPMEQKYKYVKALRTLVPVTPPAPAVESGEIEAIRERRKKIDGAPWKYENIGQTVFGFSRGGSSKQPSDYMVANIRGWGHLQYMGKTRGDEHAAALQDANGEFIGHAPTDIDTLLAEIDRLRAELASAKQHIALHAGDTLSLDNEICQIRSNAEDDAAEIVRLRSTRTAVEVTEAKFEDLSDDIRWILGRPNFACGAIAHIFQAEGRGIAKKAEDEQAFVIHWMLQHYVADRENWRANAEAELTAIKAARAALAAQEGQ